MLDVPLVASVVSERNRFVGRERTLKAIAALLVLLHSSDLVQEVSSIAAHYCDRLPPEMDALFSLPWSIIGIVFSAGVFWSAVHLWRLQSWGRIALLACAAMCPFGVYSLLTLELPQEAADVGNVGTTQNLMRFMAVIFGLIGGYFGWLGLARKTRRVTSREYHEQVMGATPEIGNDLAWTMKAALVLLGLFFLMSTASDLVWLFT